VDNYPAWLDDPNVDLLFHYTKLSTALEDIFYSKRIRFGLLCNTNDPYEKSISELQYSVLEVLKEPDVTHKFEAIAGEIHQKCRFFSTTMDNRSRVSTIGPNLGRGFAIPSLWAHYSENHRGVCLVFDRTKLIISISQQCNTQKHQFLTGPVHYTDPLGYFTSEFDVDLTRCENLHDSILEHIVEHKDTILFSKDRMWQYRIVVVCNDDKPFEIDISDSLVGIFTSYNFPDCYSLNLLRIMDYFKIHGLNVQWPFGMPYIKQWPSRDHEG